MPKKSRKGGRIGIPKTDIPRHERDKPLEKSQVKVNKKRGNKSGSRQQLAELASNSTKNEKQDVRIGSKKAIDLNKYKPGAKVATPKIAKEAVYKTPQEELEAIENNQALEALLEKQIDSKLTKDEQVLVDKLTSRYRELCDIVGIEVDEYLDDDGSVTQGNTDEDDPFAKLDAIKLDDFKD